MLACSELGVIYEKRKLKLEEVVERLNVVFCPKTGVRTRYDPVEVHEYSGRMVQSIVGLLLTVKSVNGSVLRGTCVCSIMDITLAQKSSSRVRIND